MWQAPLSHLQDKLLLPIESAEHRKGAGARLTQAVREAGITWVVARTWRGGRTLEHKLKGWHSGVKLYPICQGEITLEEVLASPPPTPGRRMPMSR